MGKSSEMIQGSPQPLFAEKSIDAPSRPGEFNNRDVLFRAAFEHAAIGMAIVDLSGRFLDVNRALCRIVGYAAEELLGSDFQSIAHPDDLTPHVTLARRLLNGEVDHYHKEKRFLHKDGRALWILLSCTAVRDVTGQASYFLAQVQDITEQRLAEDETLVRPASAKPLPPVVMMAGVCVALVGLLVLVGWIFDLTWLKAVWPGWPTMKVNTAICFVMAGGSLALFASGKWLRLSSFVGLCVMLVGAATLAEYVFGWDLRIDELFIRAGETIPQTPFPGRSSPTAAINLTLLGVALSVLASPRVVARRVAEVSILISVLISGAAVIGYLYGVEALYSIGPYPSIALHSALMFALLGLGMLFARADFEFLNPIRSEHLGGTFARKLFPVVLLMPLAVGWVRVRVQQHGLFEIELGQAIHTVLIIVVFACAAWLACRWLNGADEQRKRAERLAVKHQGEMAHLLRLNTMGEMAAGLAHEINQPSIGD